MPASRNAPPPSLPFFFSYASGACSILADALHDGQARAASAKPHSDARSEAAAIEQLQAYPTALIPAAVTRQTDVPLRGSSNVHNAHRPSRKHILDWIGRASFRDTLNGLLGPSGVTVDSGDIHRPLGHGDGVEFELADFCWCFRPRWRVHECLRSWWLPSLPLNKNARTPVWDLISTCTMLGRKGLLLVEAKTHEGELDWKGKRLDAEASEQSKLSYEHIRTAVACASHGLTRVFGARVSLDVRSHYQLATRVAWATFLASQGIPVALLYLGFTGDSAIPLFLKDDAHWQRSMGAYMIGKLPLELPEKWLKFPGGGAFNLLIRSRPVLELTANGHQQKNFPARREAKLIRDPLDSSSQDRPSPDRSRVVTR